MHSVMLCRAGRRSRQRTRQISDRAVAVIDIGGADLDKSQRRMEGVGPRIRWLRINLADHAIMAGSQGPA